MFKKLTSAQKETLAPQLKEIYKEASLSDELAEKLTNAYLKATDDACDAFNELSTVNSMGGLGTFINSVTTIADNLSVNIPCSEDEKNRIALAKEKICELPIIKNFSEACKNGCEALLKQPDSILDFSFEGLEEFDSVINNCLKKYDNREECSESEKELLSRLKEAKEMLNNPHLKDELKQFAETQKLYREIYSSKSNLALFQMPPSPKSPDSPAPSPRLGNP